MTTKSSKPKVSTKPKTASTKSTKTTKSKTKPSTTTTQAPVKRNKGGRPPTYSDDIKHEILDRLAAGESLGSICEEPGMPDRATFWRWTVADKDIREKYDACKQARARALAELALDEVNNITDRDSAYKAQVKSSTYLKLAALFDPANFSDKTHSNLHRLNNAATLNININIGNDEDDTKTTTIDITPEPISNDDQIDHQSYEQE